MARSKIFFCQTCQSYVALKSGGEGAETIGLSFSELAARYRLPTIKPSTPSIFISVLTSQFYAKTRILLQIFTNGTSAVVFPVALCYL